MKKLLTAAVLVGLIVLGQGTAHAVPILQLYIEGATYDDATQTWVLAPPGSSGGEPFRVWAIGNTYGPGGRGKISDVKLSIAFSEDEIGTSISLTPSKAGGLGVFNGIDDLSVPSVPTLNTSVETSLGVVNTGLDGIVTNGGTPMLSNGQSLPKHGIYGPGTVWQEYLLGDFTSYDSHVGDFIGSFPGTLYPNRGQINVYEVSAVGFSGATLHFDLYNHVTSRNSAKFAPFSHDADGDAHITPEPASFIVWCLIGLSWAGSSWTHRYRRRWQKWQQEEATAAAGIQGQDQADRFAGHADEVENQLGVREASPRATDRRDR